MNGSLSVRLRRNSAFNLDGQVLSMISEMHIADDATALLAAIDSGAQLSEVRPLSRALAQDAHAVEQERSGVQKAARSSLSDRFAHARSSSDSLTAARDDTSRSSLRMMRGDARA